jgi:hypothetical protein
MTDSGRATYVYCLLSASAPPLLDDAPAGLPGLSPARALTVDDGLWLVVADAPLPEYGAAAVESRLDDLGWVSTRAVAHERVVEHFAEAATVVPMKLFTMFSSDERAVRDLEERREQIGEILERVTGRREWGVRIRVDEAAARRALAEETASLRGGGGVSGKEFLRHKQRQRDAARELAARAREDVDEVLAALSREAADRRRLRAPTPEADDRLLLDAVFLVAEERTEAFEEQVREAAERLARHHCEVTLTGPWPPYNFARPAEETAGP